MTSFRAALVGFVAFAVSGAALAQGGPPKPEGWSLAVGAGLIASPTYRGDDSYALSAVPNIVLRYEDTFFASVAQGIGYNVINTRNWRAGPIGRIAFSRDEDGSGPFQIAGDESDDLLGLGDVDTTFELGGFVEYSFGPVRAKAELRQGVNGHEGLVGDVSLDFRQRTTVLDKMVILSAGPRITFADDDYHSAYFDVDAGQSAASGLTAYDAGGGILSYGIGANLIMPLTDKVSTFAFASYDRLAGDAADSSLVQERGSENQATIGAFLTYRFGF